MLILSLIDDPEQPSYWAALRFGKSVSSMIGLLVYKKRASEKSTEALIYIGVGFEPATSSRGSFNTYYRFEPTSAGFEQPQPIDLMFG